MSEFYPILTNDGSVGLFSVKDNDIYHSAYGALSESFEKFILPANLASRIIENDEVKILDICYGIGYNTKTSIQTFLNLKKYNFEKTKIFSQKKSKKNSDLIFNIAPIDTNNISITKFKDLDKKNKNFLQNNQNQNSDITNNIAQIDTDNIYLNNLDFENKNENFIEEKLKKNILADEKKDNIINRFLNNLKANKNPKVINNKKLIIDAIDIDKELVYISPFIKSSLINHKKAKNINKNLLGNISTTNKNKDENTKTFIKLQNELTRKDFISSKTANKIKLDNNINKIIYNSLKISNDDFLFNEILENNLSKKIFSSIFDKNIKKIHKLNQIKGYKYKGKGNKSTFLHNIYYQYISIRNIFDRIFILFSKNSVQNDILLNFHFDDARNSIKTLDKKYDFIFLDAFSPNKCPILWSEGFFKLLHSKLKDDGVLLTYSSAASVRNAMINAGFFVGKVFNDDLKKFTGTIAAKKNDLILYSLDDLDMALIKSKSGITYKDSSLNSSIQEVLSTREEEIKTSNLKSSTKAVKEVKNARQL